MEDVVIEDVVMVTTCSASWWEERHLLVSCWPLPGYHERARVCEAHCSTPCSDAEDSHACTNDKKSLLICLKFPYHYLYISSKSAFIVNSTFNPSYNKTTMKRELMFSPLSKICKHTACWLWRVWVRKYKYCILIHSVEC